MPRTTRVYSIDSIQLALTKSIPPSLLITAFGHASSTGWNDIRLEPLEKTLSPDGILDLDFVGVPPSGMSIPMLVPAVAHYVWKDAEKVIGVKIHARSNDLTRLMIEDQRDTMTTERVGEEQPPHPPTTYIAGEELSYGGPPGAPTPPPPDFTFKLGEDWPGGQPPTTAPIAEEITNIPYIPSSYFAEHHPKLPFGEGLSTGALEDFRNTTGQLGYPVPGVFSNFGVR